jgi:hypothetical protein
MSDEAGATCGSGSTMLLANYTGMCTVQDALPGVSCREGYYSHVDQLLLSPHLNKVFR